MANIVYDYEKQLPRLSSKMTSKPLNIEGTVKEELAFWKGKKETSSGAKARLKRYWDYIGRASWSPSGTPWSAAFVSYLLRGTGFKGSAGHYLYIKYVMEGKSPGWEAFSIPKNKDKLVIQPGDVLVKERYDPGNKYATHGDVVASIRGNKAVLVGGNISNTAKVIGKVDLKPDGTIRDSGKYQILLKKNPVTSVQYGLTKILAYGGFAVALGLTGILGFMVAKRKGLIGSANQATSAKILLYAPDNPLIPIKETETVYFTDAETFKKWVVDQLKSMNQVPKPDEILQDFWDYSRYGQTVSAGASPNTTLIVGRTRFTGSASNHLRLLPDPSQRQLIEHIVKANWPQPIVGVEYQADYQSPFDSAVNLGEVLDITDSVRFKPFDMDKAFTQVQEQKNQALFFEFNNSARSLNFEQQYHADNKIREELMKRGIPVKATSWTMPAASGYPMTLYRVEW